LVLVREAGNDGWGFIPKETGVEVDQEPKLDFSDVLISPKLSSLNSRKDVNLTRTFVFPRASTAWTVLPLIASNMDATGTVAMAQALARLEASGCLSKFIDKNTLVKFFSRSDSHHSFFSMGITDGERQRLRAVSGRVPIAKISIEVANGYIEALSRFVAEVRRDFPNAIILAGSVCTPEGTINLLKAGADIARVGIGSGSVCITRRVTGVGYPQLSAAIECSQAAHEVGGFVCSDGGCTVPGDICKAFCAGADFVMLGGMLAGHDECEGRITYKRSGTKKIPVSMEFYGMASDVAQKKHYGLKPQYGTAEGKRVSVPYRGPVSHTLSDILGGLRSMMTYIDATDMATIPANAKFVRVGRQFNNVFGIS
jgi:GMP reductase